MIARQIGLIATIDFDKNQLTLLVQNSYSALQQYLSMLNTAQGDLGGGLIEETSREIQMQSESISAEIESLVTLAKKYDIQLPK